MKKLILVSLMLISSLVFAAKPQSEPTQLEMDVSSLINTIVDENPTALRLTGDVQEGETIASLMKDFAEYIVYDALVGAPLIGTDPEDVPSTYTRILDIENTNFKCETLNASQARCAYSIRYIESHKSKNFDAVMNVILDSEGAPVAIIDNKILVDRN